MIRSKQDYLQYIHQDAVALGKCAPSFMLHIRNLLFPPPYLEISTDNAKTGVFFQCKKKRCSFILV